MIHDAWFVVLTGMLTGYAVLDGFDLGAGALHLWMARGPQERSRVIDAIGPVWNGNEVWLIAAGGALVAAFPRVYASGFSGFYLALMLVLWLLVGRGLAIEFRHQVHSELWQDACDTVFAVSSTLLALLFGVAVGNLLRGLPLDAGGRFTGSFALLLNPFALLAGLVGLAVLTLHGASYVALKTDGALHERARRWARRLLPVSGALVLALVAASFVVRPGFTANFARWPLLVLFPIAAAGAFVAAFVLQRRPGDLAPFLATGALVALLLASAAAGLYPLLLPAGAGSAHPGLDIHNAASPEGSLRIALAVYLAGMAIVIAYTVNVYRVWRGKVSGPVYH